MKKTMWLLVACGSLCMSVAPMVDGMEEPSVGLVGNSERVETPKKVPFFISRKFGQEYKLSRAGVLLPDYYELTSPYSSMATGVGNPYLPLRDANGDYFETFQMLLDDVTMHPLGMTEQNRFDETGRIQISFDTDFYVSDYFMTYRDGYHRKREYRFLLNRRNEGIMTVELTPSCSVRYQMRAAQTKAIRDFFQGLVD